MIRTVLFATAIALVLGPASAQTARQVKAAELVRLGEGLTLRVTRPAKGLFPTVKLKGAAFVVVLELDAGTKETTLSYQMSADATTSDLYLVSGTRKLPPRAVIEDFPSWGTDNDKEVELVDPQDAGATSLSFRRAGSIAILFDVPADQTATPKKLSLVLRRLKPTEQQHSLVVTL